MSIEKIRQVKKKANLIVMAVTTFMIVAITANLSFAYTFAGSNYEQRMPIPGVQKPHSTIEASETSVEEGKTVVLTAHGIVDEQHGGVPFFYWYAEEGKLECISPSCSSVNFVSPFVSSSKTVEVYVQVGDSLGYVNTNMSSIEVINKDGEVPEPTPTSNTVVPEPSSLLFFVIGLLGLSIVFKRRKR